MNRRHSLSLLLGIPCVADVVRAQQTPITPEPLPNAKPVPDMQAIPLPDNGVSFQFRNNELTRLHGAATQFRPFLFPVAALNGVSLTRMGHPRDPVTHSHHNSVWIAHQSVSGTNFWEDKAGRIELKRMERHWDSADACGCAMSNDWVRIADSTCLLKEKRSIEVRKPDASGSWLLIIECEFFAPGDAPVALVQCPMGWIGVRMAKTIGVSDGGGRVLNSAGQRNEAEAFRKPAKWMDYSGPLQQDATGGVALFDHPSNPNHPNAFHIRDDGWMGIPMNLSAPSAIEKDKPLRVRFGLWAHGGVPNAATIEASWKSFASIGEIGAADKVKK